jgi:hypothetical protein
MNNLRVATRLIIILAAMLLLFGILAGCSVKLPAAVQQANPLQETAALPAVTKTRVELPSTWTPTAGVKQVYLGIKHTPSPTFNIPQTLVAQTTVAAGVHCQRHPDAWQVYSGPAGSYAGWCMVVGAYGTLYEYKLLAPDGWVVNTFGEFTPNLIFSTGQKNVQVKINQAFAYNHRNYEGTLEDAPEKAAICDENEKCYGFIDPNETLVRQEVKEITDRKILVLDSTLGPLQIRRYYMILPFRLYRLTTQRLFIVELISMEKALNEEQTDQMLEKLDVMIRSISQR